MWNSLGGYAIVDGPFDEIGFVVPGDCIVNQGCERAEVGRQVLSRRRWLQVGGLSIAGLSLPRLLQAEATPQTQTTGIKPVPRTKSCILIFYYGGPSHLDTWDLKPHAPREVRGEFNSIATLVPGQRICEHLPRCARVM